MVRFTPKRLNKMILLNIPEQEFYNNLHLREILEDKSEYTDSLRIEWMHGRKFFKAKPNLAFARSVFARLGWKTCDITLDCWWMTGGGRYIWDSKSIELGSGASMLVLLHEMAHHICIETTGHRWHGPEFCKVLRQVLNAANKMAKKMRL